MLQRLLLVALPAAAVLAIFYVVYSLVDPLPPRRLVIGAGIAGSGYDNFARRYARVLARDGIDLRGTNGARRGRRERAIAADYHGRDDGAGERPRHRHLCA